MGKNLKWVQECMNIKERGTNKMIIDNWKMDYESYKGLECKAPCTMYGVLLEHGIIEDPFYG